MIAPSLALLAAAVSAFVWWAVTYEEGEDKRQTEAHRRKSRAVFLCLAAATVAWAVANLIFYSGRDG